MTIKLNSRIMLLIILLCILISLNLFHNAPGLLAYLLTAFGLGLRHGLDADHIVVIDNITRRLIQQRKRSSTTGLYFAAGHSTIVFIMTLTIILGFNHVHDYFKKIMQFGNNFGSIVSIVILSITLILNILMIQNIKQNYAAPKQIKGGLISRIFNRYFFNAIDNSYKMYFVGFLFGLGFDTATEIGLLALTAASLVQGINVYLILLLPIGFACGMIITDTINSTFMSKIYFKVQNNQQQLMRYNYILLSSASIITLLVIVIELADYLNEQYAIHLSW
jgi:high-affinity nickel-transport protein